jgi:hypothetical protein
MRVLFALLHMSVVVFDLESDSSFLQHAGASRDAIFARMQATVACALVLDADLCLRDGDEAVKRGAAFHWWRDVAEAGKSPFDGLLDLFDKADVIVGFNCLDFDFPLLRKHYTSWAVSSSEERISASQRYASHRMKAHDPFSRIRATACAWPKLDHLLKANGMDAKSGDGLQAIELWNKGRCLELLQYCQHDVASLAKLCLLEELHLPPLVIPAPLFSIRSAIRALGEKKHG